MLISFNAPVGFADGHITILVGVSFNALIGFDEATIAKLANDYLPSSVPFSWSPVLLASRYSL